METYQPPFTVSARAINLVAEIAALMERYALLLSKPDGLMLRKANRIKTIRSSLAIEGNELSEDEVRAVMNGKQVIAPQVQIQEVRNALRTYEVFHELDAFNLDDILRAHKLLMQDLTEDAGRFRSGGVGVFEGGNLIHLAPPAHRVPSLMHDLFRWLKNSEDHLLIRSCVFHYEFEFIHPFSDGNGRTGRLWQSLILSKANPLYAHLPVENLVHENQAAYYKAIELSSKQANCAPFIDFMLESILQALEKQLNNDGIKDGINDGINDGLKCNDTERIILLTIRKNNRTTARDLAQLLGIQRRQVEKIIAKLKSQGILQRIGARKNGYWQINYPQD